MSFCKFRRLKPGSESRPLHNAGLTKSQYEIQDSMYCTWLTQNSAIFSNSRLPISFTKPFGPSRMCLLFRSKISNIRQGTKNIPFSSKICQLVLPCCVTLREQRWFNSQGPNTITQEQRHCSEVPLRLLQGIITSILRSATLVIGNTIAQSSFNSILLLESIATLNLVAEQVLLLTMSQTVNCLPQPLGTLGTIRDPWGSENSHIKSGNNKWNF